MHTRAEQYQLLKKNPDYIDVRFDVETGGLQATHVLHSFDPRNGHFEMPAINILFKNGDKIILEQELAGKGETVVAGIKHRDGSYNDLPCEIATIHGIGTDVVKRALKHCKSKGVEVAILYFPDPKTYTEHRITEGIAKFEGICRYRFADIVVIHNNAVHKKSHL